MQPHHFSIVLLLFGLISPPMNKFLCALKSCACTEYYTSVSLAKWWNRKASLSEPRGQDYKKFIPDTSDCSGRRVSTVQTALCGLALSCTTKHLRVSFELADRS
jgi:hypothetical protein